MNARYDIRATLGPEIRLWEKENRLRQDFRKKRRRKKGGFGDAFTIVHFHFEMPGRAAFFLPLATTTTALAFLLFAKKRNVLLLLPAEVLIHAEAADVQRQHKHQQERSKLFQSRKRKDEYSLFSGRF